MSLASPLFSPESAPRPFQYEMRRRGGTISGAALPSVERQVLTGSRTHLIHRPARDILPPTRWNSRFLLIAAIPTLLFSNRLSKEWPCLLKALRGTGRPTSASRKSRSPSPVPAGTGRNSSACEINHRRVPQHEGCISETDALREGPSGSSQRVYCDSAGHTPAPNLVAPAARSSLSLSSPSGPPPSHRANAARRAWRASANLLFSGRR